MSVCSSVIHPFFLPNSFWTLIPVQFDRSVALKDVTFPQPFLKCSSISYLSSSGCA